MPLQPPRISVLALAAATVSAGAIPAQAKRSHVVSAGDSLWTISREYGCDVGAIQHANRLRTTTILVGQELRIPACGPTREREAPTSTPTTSAKSADEALRHRVIAGDTLGAIAARHRTTVADIQVRNGIEGHLIYPGQVLTVMPGSRDGLPPLRVQRGQSIGTPNSGRLAQGTRLPRHRSYFIRRPKRAFGATHTVQHVRRVAMAVRRRFPGLHRLAIGDLSARRGGKITRHSSHQSGRDVDLGFYFHKRPQGYPRRFVVAQASNLHFGGTWELISRLARTADEPGGVEKMFLSYSTQRMLYRMAVKRGVSKVRLRKIFQYPRGIGTRVGLIRHEPGHDEHIHVRFKCPEEDARCQ